MGCLGAVGMTLTPPAGVGVAVEPEVELAASESVSDVPLASPVGLDMVVWLELAVSGLVFFDDGEDFGLDSSEFRGYSGVA